MNPDQSPDVSSMAIIYRFCFIKASFNPRNHQGLLKETFRNVALFQCGSRQQERDCTLQSKWLFLRRWESKTRFVFLNKDRQQV